MLRKLLISCAALGMAFAVNAATDTTATPAAAPTAVVEKAPVEKAVAKDAVVEKININTADVKTLAKVKCVGKKKAEAIVKYRTDNGDFKAISDLLKVKCRGINAKWLKKVETKLAV